MVSRISVLASTMFLALLVPGTASAGVTVCDFRGAVIVEDRRMGDRYFAYYPAYEYRCRDGGAGYSGGYPSRIRFSDVPRFPDARFGEVEGANRWLARNEEALASLRTALVGDASSKRAERADPVFGQMVDVEVIGASALQLGAVSLTLLPQFRVLKALRWLLEAPDMRRLYGHGRGIADRRDRAR